MMKTESMNKLEKLFIKYREPLRGCIYGIIKDEMLAEDILQVTFLKVFDNIDKIQGVECKETRNYLYKIAKTTAINCYNKKKYEDNCIRTYKDNDINIIEQRYLTEVVARQNMIDKIEIHANRLKENDKNILSLKYRKELSNREIASYYEISEEAVRKRISRARMRLTEMIDDW